MQVGDRVRVKNGVEDPDFPGFEIEGWTGVVSVVDSTIYEVHWDNQTLRNMPDGVISTCEEAGFSWHVMGLRERDLEVIDV